MAKKKALKSIRSKWPQRSFSLAKLALKAGAQATSNRVSQSIFNKDKNSLLNKFVLTQVQSLTEELGQLKGSLMKVGQLLSTYGEHLLPKEANEILKSLQFESPPLDWESVHKVLIKELGAEKLSELEIQEQCYASASIGQVHRARRKSDGRELVLKVQYPGIEGAIDTDLRFLRWILAFSNLIPKDGRFPQIMSEVKAMLVQEMNYTLELGFTQEYCNHLQRDGRYLVPEPLPEYSTSKVLCTEFIPGHLVDSDEVASLSQERRNRLGLAFLTLYINELFNYRHVQTDPHFGNYRIKIDEQGENDQLVLYDFGAMREVPLKFLQAYKKIVRGGIEFDRESLLHGGRDLGLLESGDSQDLVDRFVELSFLVSEPFARPGSDLASPEFMDQEGRYAWGRSDLPNRVATAAASLIKVTKLRTPPKELIFLDRKFGGTFVFLSALNCHLEARSHVLNIIEQHDDGL